MTFLQYRQRGPSRAERTRANQPARPPQELINAKREQRLPPWKRNERLTQLKLAELASTLA